jgi:large repetitive protein
MRCLSLTRFVLSLAAVLLAVGVCAPRAQASFILHKPNAIGLSNGLVGWWTFDGKDISGVQAYDRSGNGNRGILTTGPVQAVGKIGQALQFDGVDDSVSINDANSLDLTTAVTVSAWFKADSWNTAAFINNGIVDKAAAENNTGYALFRQQSSNELDFRVMVAGPTEINATTPTPAAGVWHHAVGTYDTVNGATSRTTQLKLKKT